MFDDAIFSSYDDQINSAWEARVHLFSKKATKCNTIKSTRKLYEIICALTTTQRGSMQLGINNAEYLFVTDFSVNSRLSGIAANFFVDFEYLVS